MATWLDLSLDSFRIAREIRHSPRSCASRSYYAVYSAITDRLVQARVRFPSGFAGPRHRDLPRHIDALSGISMKSRRGLKAKIRSLYALRLDADYQPGRTVDLKVARQGLLDAAAVLSMLGIKGGA